MFQVKYYCTLLWTVLSNCFLEFQINSIPAFASFSEGESFRESLLLCIRVPPEAAWLWFGRDFDWRKKQIKQVCVRLSPAVHFLISEGQDGPFLSAASFLSYLLFSSASDNTSYAFFTLRNCSSAFDANSNNQIKWKFLSRTNYHYFHRDEVTGLFLCILFEFGLEWHFRAPRAIYNNLPAGYQRP